MSGTGPATFVGKTLMGAGRQRLGRAELDQGLPLCWGVRITRSHGALDLLLTTTVQERWAAVLSVSVFC